MNMQLRQCFARAQPTRLKISQKIFYFQKSQNFKIWLQKRRIGNLATQELKMRIMYARKLPIFYV